MDEVVIRDHYHIMTMNEHVNWMKLPNLLSIFSLTLGAIFVALPLLQNSQQPFYVHIREKKYISLAYTMYIDASNNTVPLYTRVSFVHGMKSPMGHVYLSDNGQAWMQKQTPKGHVFTRDWTMWQKYANI